MKSNPYLLEIKQKVEFCHDFGILEAGTESNPVILLKSTMLPVTFLTRENFLKTFLYVKQSVQKKVRESALNIKKTSQLKFIN